MSDITKKQSYYVVKDNALIQRTRYSLSTQQQKLLLFMISKIKPHADENTRYSMSIKEYCLCCDITEKSGTNYTNIKNSLKQLADKSMWYSYRSGREVLLRWLNRVCINKNSGIIEYTFHPDMLPFLIDLKECYTQYSLENILPLKSTFSIRLYEILRSYANLNNPVVSFSIDELRKKMGLEENQYPRFSNFKQTVLDVAIDEIYLRTDIWAEYKLEKVNSRSYNKITFTIHRNWDDI